MREDLPPPSGEFIVCCLFGLVFLLCLFAMEFARG
jgi:hypothetical protein